MKMGHAFDNNFSFFFATWEWHGPPSLGRLNGFINLVPVGAFALSALVGRVPSSVQVLGAAMTCVALIGNNICTRYHAHQKAEAATCEA